MSSDGHEFWRPYVALAKCADSAQALKEKVGATNDLSPAQLTELLFLLAEFGRPGCMAALVAKGADPNGYDDEGCTPLNACMDAANEWVVASLRQANEAQMPTGPLLSFVELLSVGADPNLPLQQRSTSPLQLAIARNLPAFAAVLLVFGADPSLEEPDTGAETVLDKIDFWEKENGSVWPRQLLLRNRR